MSTELDAGFLDDLFDAVGRDIDALVLPPADTARHRGQVRRRAQTALAVAVTLVLAAGAILAGGALRHWSGAQPPAGPPRPSGILASPTERVGFQRLTAVGTAVIPGVAQLPHGPTDRSLLLATDGDVGYVGWLDVDAQTLRVAAVDLGTARLRWGPVELGRYNDSNGLFSVPGGVLVLGESNSGTGPGYEMYAVAGDTGAVRWHRPFDINTDGFLPLAAAMVLSTSQDHTIRGLDWRTGRELWSAPAHGPELVPVITRAALFGPASLFGAYAPVSVDPRVLEIGTDGALRIYSGVTGALLSTVDGVGSAGASYRAVDNPAYGDTLFVAAGSPYQLRSYDLAHPDRAPRSLYTGPAGRTVLDLAACGDGLGVCVLDQVPNSLASQLALIRIRPGPGQYWRTDVGMARALIPAGAHILISGLDPAARSLLFDRDGKQLLSPQERAGRVGRISEVSLIAFGGGDPSGTGSVPVVGLDLVGLDRRPLGQVPDGGGGCQWTDRYLACPGVTGVEVWRFA